MTDNNKWSQSPLIPKDIQLIEDAQLSNLERHHLRLLAHCLESFKRMANGSPSGPLPDERARLQWCLDQPALANEEAFISLLLEQFAVAARQLENLAANCKTSPLELTVIDLIEEMSR